MHALAGGRLAAAHVLLCFVVLSPECVMRRVHMRVRVLRGTSCGKDKVKVDIYCTNYWAP
jgi:hypothetical protein